ncbi:MAG: hypothetical protein DWH78_14780 [Planctomycetota bacterium]|nr:MAG: hypothetical protein DWH78_14780 [Planctomycetota bacterium]
MPQVVRIKYSANEWPAKVVHLRSNRNVMVPTAENLHQRGRRYRSSRSIQSKNRASSTRSMRPGMIDSFPTGDSPPAVTCFSNDFQTVAA